ncbi:hypothetical protein N7471_009428 [Penicillium samsonianum]|uniref:uncharacterized protein n=1 Tax=Penicillium samsonianum TaxID=1882272 RepID=UPI0025468C69|nr:uncharacterized protein N7471_009428 [Penicillium samsonianum]KAJ6128211.1 hypothetical protein N7471_009428 [Penicillium samsonianum]
MSQSHNYSWVDPNLHDGNRLCALRGHRPCTCAGLYLEPTRHFANSSIMNQSSTYHQPTIAPWYNSNWCQSDSLAQVPIPSSSQWNPSVGYNPADPLNMSIFGTGHSPMHDKSNLVAAIQSSPVQVYAPLGNTGYAQSEEQSIYYGSPAEQHVAQDPQFPLPCYWGGPKHGLFPNFESLINHLKTDHIDPQYQAQPNQA